MSEYELVYLISEYVNRNWLVIQVWAGVSFGLVAISHFSTKHLNTVLVAAISVLYICFSIFSMSIFKANGHVVSGFIMDLVNATNNGVTLTNGAQRIISAKPGYIAMPSILIAFFGTFIGSLVFLWWSFIKSSRTSR